MSHLDPATSPSSAGGGAHGFRNDGDAEATRETAELPRSGRTLGAEERTASYARHDQVMVDAWVQRRLSGWPR